MPDPGGLKGQMAPGDAHPYLAPFEFYEEGFTPPFCFRSKFENLYLPLKRVQVRVIFVHEMKTAPDH